MKFKEIKKLTYKEIEALVRDTILIYEDGWNQANNPEYNLKFNLTLSFHKIPDKETAKNRDVAYIRLERHVTDSDEKDVEHYRLYNNVYEFKNIGERTNPEKWKKELYLNLLITLVSGGLEYAELTNRLRSEKEKQEREGKKEEMSQKKTDIQITDKMPEPLKEDEKEYKMWVDKNNENVKKKKRV